MRNLVQSVMRVACSAVLAFMCLPAASISAFAEPVASGEVFQVGNFQYKVTVSSYRYVQLRGVVDPTATGDVIEVPENVVYSGETYKVVGIQATAFQGCTQVKDIRIPDLGDGQVYPEAFDDCKNLEAIHFMGKFSFIEPTHYTDDFAISSVKFIIHEGDWCFNETGGVTFPVHSETYYGVDFVQDGVTQTVYVAGPTRIDGTTSGGTTPAQLCDPSSVSVYCDASEGAKALCPVSQVPQLKGDNDAWSVLDSEGELLAVTDNLSSTATATAISSGDLSSATVEIPTMYCDYTAQQPDVTVLSANGSQLEEGVDYRISIFSEDGAAISAISEPGSYTVTVTGIGSYTGSKSSSVAMLEPCAMWLRASGSDTYATAQAISSSVSTINTQATNDSSTRQSSAYNGEYADEFTTAARNHRAEAATGYIYSGARIVVNPDDYASCLIGTSLASLFGVTTVSTPCDLVDGDLLACTKVQLTSARNGFALVMGSQSCISEDVRTAIASRVDGGAPRVGGSATNAAQEAVAAYKFIRDVEDGRYTLTLPSSYLTYGSTALVIPQGSAAEAFSAMAWGYKNCCAVFFCGEDGSLDADTLAALKDKDENGDRYFTNVVVPGGSSGIVSNLSSALSGVSVTGWEGSSNACESSLEFAEESVANGSNSYAVTFLSAPGCDYGCMAATSCAAGSCSGAMVILDFANEYDAAMASFKKFAYKVSYGIVAAGYDDIPQQVLEDIRGLWARDTYTGSMNLYLANAKLDASSYAYTGSSVAPMLTVTDKDGKVLQEGTDYTVSYVDNATGKALDASQVVDPGTYTVTATGSYRTISGGFDYDDTVAGFYRHTRSASFEIVGDNPEPEPAAPAKAKIKKIKVGKKQLKATWAKVENASKYQLRYRIMGASSWKKVSASGKATSAVVKNLLTRRRYEVCLRAGNTVGWGAWSATKLSAKVK